MSSSSARSIAREPSCPGLGYEGRVLGGFRLLREIACGGMASVYLGHRPGFGGVGQTAAVKVIHSHLARDREFVDMFLDEARIVACVRHPNVCSVIDFGRSEGTYYLAMEYVMGETWGDVLQAMAADPRAEAFIPLLLAQVLAQACEGLHAAHEARDERGEPLHIVHRDVSPQNLIIGYDGNVRVLDFGVASAAERLHTTRTGAIKGRISFMAPEQARGLAVDRRADIWSLGVVLWEALARRRLFKRDSDAETVLAVTQDTLPNLEDCGYPVPPKLARIAMKALDREPDERYQTAREMGLELSRFAASLTRSRVDSDAPAVPPFGVAEVALWMERLFGEQIREKRALLARAARAVQPVEVASVDDDAPTLIADKLRERANAASPSVSAVREVASKRSEDDTCLERPRRLPQFSAAPQPRPVAQHTLAVAAVTGLMGLLAGAWFATAMLQGSLDEQRAFNARLAAASAIAEVPLQRAGASSFPGEPAVEPARAGGSGGASSSSATTDPVEPPSALATSRPHAALPQAGAGQPVQGWVSIATPGGWAFVMEGDRRLGTAPGRFKLAAGSHTLRLWPFGKRKRELSRFVQVSRARPATLRIPIKR